MREKIDYFNAFVKDAIKQLKRGNKVYLSNREQLEEIRKHIKVHVLGDDGYFITVKKE